MRFSKKIEKSALSPMRKFHPYAVAAEANGRKIYHLNIGQPDIETPAQFFEAVRGFDQKIVSYAPSPGLPVLLQAIAKYYEKLDVSLEAEDILVTTGGSEALNFVLQCVLDDGDEILIPEPYYPNYNTMVNLTGAKICPVPTSPEQGYHYADREKLERCIHKNTRAILCTNPGNPTGTLLTQQEMDMLVSLAKEHDLFLIADEAYREFAYEQSTLATFGRWMQKAPEQIVLIDTVSKRFSACGARVGCLISKNRALMQNCMKLAQARLSVATLDQLAAAALYSVDASYFAAVREEYCRRRDTVVRKLREIPGVVFQCPKGAFYLMAALPVRDADAFQMWLLEQFEDQKETVMFAPGASMYATEGKGRNEIRIAYVLNQQDLERAMDLLAMGIAAYQKLEAR